MNYLKTSLLLDVRRFTGWSAYSLLLILAMSVPAWAQEPDRPKPSWVMSYLLVMLCVGLGTFVVCRGAKRFK